MPEKCGLRSADPSSNPDRAIAVLDLLALADALLPAFCPPDYLPLPNRGSKEPACFRPSTKTAVLGLAVEKPPGIVFASSLAGPGRQKNLRARFSDASAGGSTYCKAVGSCAKRVPFLDFYVASASRTRRHGSPFSP